MRFQDSFDLLSGFRIRIAVFDSGQFGLRAYRPQMEFAFAALPHRLKQHRRKGPIALRGLGPAPAAIRFTAISPLDVRVHVTATENLRQNPGARAPPGLLEAKFALQRSANGRQTKK
jgi:hypothetical protein